MRRVLTTMAVAAVVLFATAAVADARPTVNMGMATVNGCDPFGKTHLQGCAVKDVWFRNTSGKRVNFNEIELIGHDGGFSFGPDPFASSCLNFFIPAHGQCFTTVYASPSHIGWNSGELNIRKNGVILDHARLVVHGVMGGAAAIAAPRADTRVALTR